MRRITFRSAAFAIMAACTTVTAQPANDMCTSATPVGEGSHFFDTTSATNDYSGTCGSSSATPDVWFLWTFGISGNAIAETCGGATWDTVLEAVSACGGPTIICNDDTCGLQSRISLGTVTAGQQVLIRVSGFSGRTGSGSLTLSITPPPPPPCWDESVNGGGDAGDLPGSAQATTGSGNLCAIAGSLGPSDADVYVVNICDFTNFVATTFNTTTTFDTQLWLFRPDGSGVTFNDDIPAGFPGAGTLQSRISGTFLTGNATYLLGISRYDRDAIDASSLAMWNDTPYTVERAPDGPGAAGLLSAWTGATAGPASYRIDLTGVCFPGPSCDPDVNCDGSADGFDVEAMEQMVGGDPSNFCQADADFNHDGSVDGFDVEALEQVIGGAPCP